MKDDQGKRDFFYTAADVAPPRRRLCARSGMDDDLALALRLQEEEQSRHPPAPAGEEDEAYARQLQREEEKARAGGGSDDAALAERLQTEEAETSLAERIRAGDEALARRFEGEERRLQLVAARVGGVGVGVAIDCDADVALAWQLHEEEERAAALRRGGHDGEVSARPQTRPARDTRPAPAFGPASPNYCLLPARCRVERRGAGPRAWGGRAGPAARRRGLVLQAWRRNSGGAGGAAEGPASEADCLVLRRGGEGDAPAAWGRRAADAAAAAAATTAATAATDAAAAAAATALRSQFCPGG